MAIGILLLCFGLLFLSYGSHTYGQISAKEAILSSVLLFSALLILVTELTGTFQILHFQSLLISWSFFSILLLVFLLKHKKTVGLFIRDFTQKIIVYRSKSSSWENILLLSVSVLLLLVFIQGIAYPPNNYDSLTYHLARTTSWISHGSVAHYPTHIFRQVYQPPFSEYIILHINILTGNDYFSASVQLFFLLFCFIALASLIELLGLNRHYQLIAVVLAITIPEVVLQASSTQNDIVVSFFILTSLYFAIKTTKETTLKNVLFLGLSAGIGILTKGTAYLYLIPVFLVYGGTMIYSQLKNNSFSFLYPATIIVIICLSINAGLYVRNYSLTHNPLGAGGSYSNRSMSPSLLVSSVLKNIGLHISPVPFDPIINRAMYKLHTIAGIDINHPGVNFLNSKYNTIPPVFNHEDLAPNPIHICLLLFTLTVAVVYLLKHRVKPNALLLYTTVVLLQGFLFCFVLKWQPWHTRLHTPLFLTSVPLMCCIAHLKPFFHKALHFLLPVLIAYVSLVVLFNRYRPFVYVPFSNITAEISIMDNRYKKFFPQHPDLYKEYENIVKEIEKEKYERIGLIMAEDDCEYPLFSPVHGKMRHPIHILVTKNPTKKLALSSDRIDCIVSTTLNQPAISFKGKSFENQSINHKKVWLYELRQDQNSRPNEK
ncbi:ArnT family glycosyltransferase [Runella sp.]|uniref:ArnT family glycosyltransferase n=1 Tax=Runella sp. TaxID=1960881 RepID=UPI003D111093